MFSSPLFVYLQYTIAHMVSYKEPQTGDEPLPKELQIPDREKRMTTTLPKCKNLTNPVSRIPPHHEVHSKQKKMSGERALCSTFTQKEVPVVYLFLTDQVMSSAAFIQVPAIIYLVLSSTSEVWFCPTNNKKDPLTNAAPTEKAAIRHAMCPTGCCVSGWGKRRTERGDAATSPLGQEKELKQKRKQQPRAGYRLLLACHGLRYLGVSLALPRLPGSLYWLRSSRGGTCFLQVNVLLFSSSSSWLSCGLGQSLLRSLCQLGNTPQRTTCGRTQSGSQSWVKKMERTERILVQELEAKA